MSQVRIFIKKLHGLFQHVANNKTMMAEKREEEIKNIEVIP